MSKPDDQSLDEAVELLSTTQKAVHTLHGSDGFFYKRFDEAPDLNVALPDGSVRFLCLPLPKELAIALLTADRGNRAFSRNLITIRARN